MKENNQTVEYFIIGIPREIQGRIVFDEFYVALIDDIILKEVIGRLIRIWNFMIMLCLMKMGTMKLFEKR